MESTYEPVGTSTGFAVPMTLNFYNVAGTDSVGTLVASYSVDQFIQWRPEASPGCGSAWMASNGQCYNGLAQTVTFQLNNLQVPKTFIWGLVFNTQNYGPSPTGIAGPYNSLNVGLSGGAAIGSDLVAGSVYWNTSYGGFYTDGGAGGVGTFRRDTNWEGYDPAASFTATPEPSTFFLFGAGLVAVAGLRKRFTR